MAEFRDLLSRLYCLQRPLLPNIPTSSLRCRVAGHYSKITVPRNFQRPLPTNSLTWGLCNVYGLQSPLYVDLKPMMYGSSTRLGHFCCRVTGLRGHCSKVTFPRGLQSSLLPNSSTWRSLLQSSWSPLQSSSKTSRSLLQINCNRIGDLRDRVVQLKLFRVTGLKGHCCRVAGLLRALLPRVLLKCSWLS